LRIFVFDKLGRAFYFHGKVDEALAVFELLEQFAVKHTTAIDEGNIKWVEDGLYYVPFIAFSKGWGCLFFFSLFIFHFPKNLFHFSPQLQGADPEGPAKPLDQVYLLGFNQEDQRLAKHCRPPQPVLHQRQLP